jgi:hypothetical protein
MYRSAARRLGAVAGTLVVLVGAVVLGTAQPALAAAYDYKPGHPMMRSPGMRQCTGSWVVVGASGSFFLTAGHCEFPGIPGQEWTAGLVYGTSTTFGHFGSVRRNDHAGGPCDGQPKNAMDLQLIQPRPNLVGSYQIVSAYGVDTGRVVGMVHNNQLVLGGAVGKFGWRGGSTQGTIAGTAIWCNGERVYIATYGAMQGDSGGPVYINDGQGRAWAVGVHVGTVERNGVVFGAFISIDDALARFGAGLPVFGALARQAPPVQSGQPVPHVEVTERMPG